MKAPKYQRERNYVDHIQSYSHLNGKDFAKKSIISTISSYEICLKLRPANIRYYRTLIFYINCWLLNHGLEAEEISKMNGKERLTYVYLFSA